MPTKDIPESASRINQLYRRDDMLFKMSNNVLTRVDSFPIRIVINEFWEWAIRDWTDSPSQVLLVGFNNSTFDDHVLLNQSKLSLETDLLTTVRRSVFVSDLRTILKYKKNHWDSYIWNVGVTL